jgi:hypothetical protein
MSPTTHQPPSRHVPADTTSDVAASRALVKSTHVILRLWGCTDADIARAEENARCWHFSGRWEVVEVIPSIGTPCPIPPRDPIALSQNAMYDAAWAAYRATETPP